MEEKSEEMIFWEKIQENLENDDFSPSELESDTPAFFGWFTEDEDEEC